MSLDANELVRAVKQAALDAVKAGRPMCHVQGTVETVSPLSIRIDQKRLIYEEQLILTDRVRDYTVEMSFDHQTGEAGHSHAYSGSTGAAGETSHSHAYSGVTEESTHSHSYAGRKPFTVHNALQVGEKVILLQCAGGQQFIVLDRWEAR